MRRALVCTGNHHKVSELAGLLPQLHLEPLPSGATLPPEIGRTFLDNARIKAVGGLAHAESGAWVIADDSGLVVDALGGRPGVHSARFAGPDASDADNVRRLLDELEHITDPAARGAHFTCVLVAIAPDGTEHVARGTVAGHITTEPRGTTGFGYDPVFVPDGEQQTFAELGASAKSQRSHRARAAAMLADQLLTTTPT